MIRVAIFARVSTLKSEQDESYQRQITYFEEYIRKSSSLQLSKIYAERVSGTSIEKRAVFQQMLQDAKQKQFDMLLVKSISRFGRNTLEGLQAIRLLQQNQIRVKTIEDAFDTDTCDEFTFTLLISLAQKEVEKMSDRIKWGKEQKARQNFYNGSHAPYGYIRLDHRHLDIAKDISASVVKEIFNLALLGYSSYEITRIMNEKGYPTPSIQAYKKNASSNWHSSTILNILKNPIYCGKLIQRKQITLNILSKKIKKLKKEEYIYVPSPYPALIDETTFTRVQEIISKKIPIKNSSISLFSGILYCGICGSRYHYKKQKNSYLCGTVNHKGKKHCAQIHPFISQNDLVEYIEKDLKQLLYSSLASETFVKKLFKQYLIEVKLYNEESKIIKKQLLNLKKEKCVILTVFSKNLISSELFEEKFYQLDKLHSSLEKQLELQNKKNSSLFISIEEFKKQLVELIEGLSVDRELLLTFIEKIVIEQTQIHIYYSFLC